MNRMTAMPPAPNRRMEPEVFIPLADAHAAAQGRFVTEANALADDVQGHAVSASADAASAMASRLAAAASEGNAAFSAASALAAPSTSGSSLSNLVVGLGARTFATQPGKAFVVGQQVSAVSVASPANYMLGTVTAYNTGTGALTLDVTGFKGEGAYADWSLAFLGALPTAGRVAGQELVTDGAQVAWGASAYSCLSILNFLGY